VRRGRQKLGGIAMVGILTVWGTGDDGFWKKRITCKQSEVSTYLSAFDSYDDHDFDIELLKIQELQLGRMYDMVDNPHPDYLLYYVDEEGLFCKKDTVMNVKGRCSRSYNEMLETRFYEV
jgi:hypothetical protein